MKKKYKISKCLPVILLLQCVTFISLSQTTFAKAYTTTLDQSGNDVMQTSDGGYLIAGSTTTSIVNDVDVYIVKTNASGDTSWTRTYGGNSPDYPNGMIETADGNYIFVGSTMSFGTGDSDNYLLKINSLTGDTMWTRHYGGPGNEESKGITATADGNYVIVGSSNSPNIAVYQAELLKIHPDGSLVWDKFYGSMGYETARSVKLCSDGGFIVVGSSALTSTSVASIYLIKTNAAGDTAFTKKYAGPNSYQGKSILVNAADGTYTLCADDSSQATDNDVKVMNISSNGMVVNWSYVYGGGAKDICKMIQPTSDGGYVVAGISRSFGWGNPDMWMLKLNSGGDTAWTRHYGGSGHEHCYDARQTADGGYVIIGRTHSFTPNFEIYMVKTDSMGHILAPVQVPEIASDNGFQVYPNPSAGMVTVDLSGALSSTSFKILNELGQTVFSGKIEPASGSFSKTVDLKNNQPGIYFLSVETENKIITCKLVLN